MKIKVESANGCKTTVESDGEDITIWQEDGEGDEERDMVMLFDAEMTRKFIKAIKEHAEGLGWEV